MTIQNLSTVTLETIENYRHAATLAVMAYRTGSNRLIDAVNDSLEANVYSRTGRVAPQLTNKLIQVRGGLTDIIVKGIGEVSTRTEKAIEASSNVATKGVTQAAEFAAGIENRVAANGIEAVARLSMPGAKAALAVSAKVAEGVDTLSRVAAGKKVKAARVVKTAKRPAVRARRSVARKVATTKTVATRKVAAPRKAAAATKPTVARAKRKPAAVAAA